MGTHEPRGRGWKLGSPYWTGPSDRIQVRTSGRVTRVRAFYVRSRPTGAPPRAISTAGSPLILSRAAWGASERIRRGNPDYADAVRFAVVHHTAGRSSYTRAQSASIVRGVQRYHVLANGWNDIGYNFLVDKYGQIFEGRYGGVDRNVVGAHAQGFNQGSTGVALIGSYDATAVTPAAKAALTRLLAWRLDAAHVDPTTTFSWRSTGNPKFPAGRTVDATHGRPLTGTPATRVVPAAISTALCRRSRRASRWRACRSSSSRRSQAPRAASCGSRGR